MSETETATEALENCMKILAILLLILPSLAFAHDREQPIKVSETVINKYTSIYQDKGVAAAIAQSQLHFDSSTHRLQIAVGAGTYNSESSFAVGAALKLGAQGPLISGSVSRDSLHTGVGVGATFRF